MYPKYISLSIYASGHSLLQRRRCGRIAVRACGSWCRCPETCGEPFLAEREPRPFHHPCSTLPCFPRANLCTTVYSTVVCIGLKDGQDPHRTVRVRWLIFIGASRCRLQANPSQLSTLSVAGVLRVYSSRPILVGLHHQCAVLLTVLLNCLVANQHYPCSRIVAVLKPERGVPALFYQQQSSYTRMASTHLGKTPK